MPKNSRRKKDTRQRAVRKGERYMRAWHSAATQTSPPTTPVPADLEVDCFGMGLEPIRRVQRLVEARGWVVAPFSAPDLDPQGMARNTQAVWDYAAAFGGIEFDDDEDADEDVLPMKPTCLFSWDDPVDDGWVVVDTAGNWDGCEQHRPVRHRLPLTRAGLDELPRLLADIEAQARALEPSAFIECLASGICATRVRQRQEQAYRSTSWPLHRDEAPWEGCT